MMQKTTLPLCTAKLCTAVEADSLNRTPKASSFSVSLSFSLESLSVTSTKVLIQSCKCSKGYIAPSCYEDGLPAVSL